MKYTILLALLVCAVFAQEEAQNSAEVELEAEEASMLLPSMYMNRMRYSAMTNQMMANPPQQAIEYYSQMKDEDFPVDYSLACSNSCGCRTYCVVMWWIPCNCMCPPPCPPPTAAPQPPRLPPRLTTTQAPWRPGPEPINPPSWNNRWPQPPVWVDPNNPKNHPTHPPQAWTTTTQTPIWNPRPPNWNNQWDPNNPSGHLTHPPATTEVPTWPQRPQQPQWPQHPQQPQWPQQPQQPQWPQQPQQPQWPQQPQQPQWPAPEPDVPWWQQPQPQPQPLPLPDQNNPWWQQQQPQPLPQPLPDQNNPWWQPQQPQPLPEPNPPQFPNWNQPPPQNDLGLCDNTCSCTPCTIIWICPVQCSPACCASRRFGNAEEVDQADAESQKTEQKDILDFKLPDYLKDIFDSKTA